MAVVAAAAATVLLRPRGGLIEPAAVDAAAYFSAAELERAAEFRGPQRLIAVAGIVVSGATLALIALRPPPAMRRAFESAGSRPILGAAAVGGALSLVVAAVDLPLAAVAHSRAVDVGLSTQDWGPWLVDLGKSSAIGVTFAAGGAAAGLALVRRFPRRWWMPAAGLVVGVSAAFVYAAPVVLDPVFNRFTPLPRGELRADVIALADRAGVEVGEVYRVDASRRTTGANAYVGGLGATKRVVLYDNLLERFPPEQVRSVVAHELSHVEGRDLPRGLLWLAMVAPGAMLVAQRLSERVAGERLGTPGSVPALALALALVAFAGGGASNVLSRQVESRADAFALELTRDPAGFIGLERHLATQNVSEPDPPRLLHLLFGTHPTTLERIGFGLTYARGD